MQNFRAAPAISFSFTFGPYPFDHYFFFEQAMKLQVFSNLTLLPFFNL